MTETLEMVDKIPRELGLADLLAVVSLKDARWSRGTWFSADFFKQPNLAVVVARKA